jgi:hypothetical protein
LDQFRSCWIDLRRDVGDFPDQILHEPALPISD